MTDAEKEQVWNALHSGKMAAATAHGFTMHVEGATALFEAVDKEIREAMDIVNKNNTTEGQ